jgi:[ribosomal protein S5]-alanine N-acetyltransferase
MLPAKNFKIECTEMVLRILQQHEDKTASLFESADCQSLLLMYEDYYPRAGFNLPWVAYLVVKDDKVVGSCGFTGQPIDGKVEIAYWTFKEFEGQGIASFACKELIRMSQDTDPALVITAKTAPEHNASTRILENNKFNFVGIVQDEEIGDAWLWTLKPG